MSSHALQGLMAALALVTTYYGIMILRRKETQREEAKVASEPTEERVANVRARTGGMQPNMALRQLIYNSTGRNFGVVKRLYVIPGGGPGAVEDRGYPPWTAQRVTRALERYDPKHAETTAFLALGAGSMNVASARRENGRVVFESTRIAEELARGGVPPGSIIADFVSWDTVGNAWFARMAVEALLDMALHAGDNPDELHAVRPKPAAALPSDSPFGRTLPYAGGATSEGGVSEKQAGEKKFTPETKQDTPASISLHDDSTEDEARSMDANDEKNSKISRQAVDKSKSFKLPAARAGEAYAGGEMRKWMFKQKANRAKARRGPLNVTIFVSDFHAERVDTIFQWVFGLEPSLLDHDQTTVTTVSIDTPVEMWARGQEQWRARVMHEHQAIAQAKRRATEVRTVEDMNAFMILGAHKGYFDLTHGQYTATAGGGWGDAS